ncbi:MAG: hypothetical protein KKE50_06445 [Nanoarchaeota archaeon]|nr:hypothetical protein [Nanoarchaeota archaeon]
MVKKRSPREIIQSSKNPSIEVSAIKFPCSEVVLDVSLPGTSKERETLFDYWKIRKLWKKHGKRKYGLIHTHPYSSNYLPDTALPSDKDIRNFLGDDNQQELIVYNRNSDSGEIFGGIIITKTRDTPKMHYSPINLLSLLNTHLFGFASPSWDYHEMKEWIDNTWDKNDTTEYDLERTAKKYNLKYRKLKGSELKVDTLSDNRGNLEQKVSSVVAIGGLLSSFFFLGSSVTGNAIGSLGKSSGSWLGLVLFLVGIAGVFWYFRSKKR